MTSPHDAIFSDIVQNLVGERVTATIEHETDEFGHPNVTVTQGPVEVHMYTSEHGGVVVEVNYTEVTSGEDVQLRVYENDITVYDSHIDTEADDQPDPTENEEN